MQLDTPTLTALAEELAERIVGARVEDVFSPAPNAIALQLYGGGRNRWLIASAHPQLARVHLLDRKPRKLVAEPSSFVMLLRKHLEGTRLAELRKPPPGERILELGFCARSESAPVWLVLELMGKLSNIVVRAAEGTILGALHPVSAHVNSYRALLPNAPYQPPPPQTRALHGAAVPRLDARTVTAEELREAAEDVLEQAHSAAPQESAPNERRRHGRGRRRGGATVGTLLTSSIAGMGREVADEIVFRALGVSDVALEGSPQEPAPVIDWEALAATVHELAAQAVAREYEPTLVYANDEDPVSARPMSFAIYRPRRFVDAVLRPAENVNAMLTAYYADAEWQAGVEAGKAPLAHTLRTQIERCRRKDRVLREELRALDEAARLRLEADVLLAFQTEVPEQTSQWQVANPFGAGEILDIALNPRLTAVENANVRYTRYHKLQRASSQIPPQIEANATELARLEQFVTDLALAETPAEVAQVRAVIAEAGYLGRGAQGKGTSRKPSGARPPAKRDKSARGKPARTQRRPEPGGTPSTFIAADGMAILVGKNSRQNEMVTFREGHPNDTWLHARGVPGAHVVIRNHGRPVEEATLREAAALAAYFSQARMAGTVPVDHTEVRYVRHMHGGGPGMVIYERERTLYVAPHAPEDSGAPGKGSRA
jgi:predicted ribosome quality control (RQC) complex YloA/Tae2 family protein